MVRNVGLYLVFLGLSIVLFGQDEFIELKIEPQTVEVGQPFSITVKTNVNGNIELNLPDEFTQSGARQSGMSSSIKIVHGKRKAVRFSFQSFSGSIGQKGKYLFGPAKVVSSTGEQYKSKSYTIKIIQPRNMISEDPSKNLDKLVFGIIEQSKKKIYEGQPIVVSGKVYSKVDVMQVADYAPFTFSGPADTRSLDPSNRVSVSYTVVNGKKLQTFDIGKTLIFPEKVGVFELQPFRTTIVYNDPRKFFPDQLKIVSNSSKVIVKPLPNGIPKNFIDGVGQFKIYANIDKTHILQGKVVELHVKIKGQGNLQNIKKPKINLPANLSFYGDPEVRDTISYSSLGAEGSKTFIYYIQVNRAGDIQFDPIKIAYFNPVAEQYETAECRIKTLHVKSNGKSIQNNSLPPQEVSQEPTMRPYVTEKKGDNKGWTNFFSGWGGTLVILSPIMLGAVIGLGFRIKKEKEESNWDRNQRIQYKLGALAKLENLGEKEQTEQAITISKILIRFLATQFNAGTGEITRTFLKDKVPNAISEEIYLKTIDVLNELDTIKYGGSINQKARVHLIDEVKEIINSFEQ